MGACDITKNRAALVGRKFTKGVPMDLWICWIIDEDMLKTGSMGLVWGVDHIFNTVVPLLTNHPDMSCYFFSFSNYKVNVEIFICQSHA